MNNFNAIAVSIAIVLFAIVLVWPVINGNPAPQTSTETLLTEAVLGDGSEAILPIPLTVTLDNAKVSLGEKLFFDTRLSGNGFSCATCHPPDRAAMDGLPLSIVTDGGFDVKNTPTLFNSGFNSLQQWNGRTTTLEQQLDAVIHNPQHMNSSWPLLLSRLNDDHDYQQLFARSYPAGITRRTVTDAITTYERSLITPNADFDRYLRGEQLAITQQQTQGYQLFQQYGCISCHQGINVGGNLFARFGIYENGQSAKPHLTDYDYGRYSYTQDQRDRFVFRVPSLRNVARTAPYFHDGSAETLYDAISTMARIQLNVDMPDRDIRLIAAFLNSLSGEYRGKPL